MNFNKIVVFTATAGPVGYLPVAPGTWASAAALPICALLNVLSGWIAWPLLIILAGLAVITAHHAEDILDAKDPRCIVIDEVVGMVITLFLLPITPIVFIIGFFLFRGLDVLKPFPIGLIDRSVHGGMGIVLDDVVAGIIGNIILRILLPLFA